MCGERKRSKKDRVRVYKERDRQKGQKMFGLEKERVDRSGHERQTRRIKYFISSGTKEEGMTLLSNNKSCCCSL